MNRSRRMQSAVLCRHVRILDSSYTMFYTFFFFSNMTHTTVLSESERDKHLRASLLPTAFRLLPKRPRIIQMHLPQTWFKRRDLSTSCWLWCIGGIKCYCNEERIIEASMQTILRNYAKKGTVAARVLNFVTRRL